MSILAAVNVLVLLQVQAMTSSLTITDLAHEKFAAALADEKEGTGVRVAVYKLNPVNLHYELEIVDASAKTDEDLEIEQGGICFWIDPHSAELIEGTTIDYLVGAGGEGFKFRNPNDLRYKTWDDPIAAKFQKFLETDINPGIAAHGGIITLVDYAEGVATIHMGGGCQGCGQADATLRQGVEAQVKAAIPEITQIIDTTDHESGKNPYY
jgi:Fe/S biogenesis protein NfuA